MSAPTLLFFFFPFAFTWGIFAICIIPYFLPTIVALMRRSASTGGIFLLNFFLGWTFIGWIISLVWAISSRNSNPTIIVNNTYPAGSGQPYGPPPTYNPPPYPSEPSRASHQTAPTLRRPSSTDPGPQDRPGR